jgi:hypothetical protein
VNRRRDERGAVVVIVAIVAILLFGAAAYAIDAGNLWQTRRQMVTAADAAALGAAGEYAVGDDGCAGAGPALLGANRDDATLEVCQPSTADTRHGYVTVKGNTTVSYAFAGVFGLQTKTVDATTTAEWGIPSAAVGLRPIALCITATPQLEEWLNLPTGPSGPSAEPIRITLSNAHPDSCKDDEGNVAGNWGLAFGSGNNANADTVEWLYDGYPDEVEVGADIHANPGAFSGGIQSAMRSLRDNGTWFGLPVFDRAVGNGNNARYHVVAFVWVQLVDFDVTGAEQDRYISLNFDRGVLQGKCCGSGLDTGTRVVRICDVDTLAPNTSEEDAC